MVPSNTNKILLELSPGLIKYSLFSMVVCFNEYNISYSVPYFKFLKKGLR